MSKLQIMKGDAYCEKRLRKWLQEDGRVVVQTKRDEIRCLVEIHVSHEETDDPEFRVTYTSASGKPLYNLGGFDAVWWDFYKRTGKTKIDTGISVNESFDLTRRTVMAKTKPYDLTGVTESILYDGREPDPDNPGKKRDKLHFAGTLVGIFYLYDIVDHYGTYEDRRRAMARYAKEFYWFLGTPETFVVAAGDSDTVIAESEIVRAVQEIAGLFEGATGAGFEGLMVKRYYYSWEPKRCPDAWMKLKPSGEVDVKIIGWTEGKDGFAGMVGSLLGEAEDGSLVSFSGFNLELREELTADVKSFYGRWAEVRYMQRDSKGGYRHPAFYRWHPDK